MLVLIQVTQHKSLKLRNDFFEMKTIKSVYLVAILLLTLVSCSKQKNQYASISESELNDKIKGAWAGKMIGVMKGIEMEFKVAGETYEDSIPWHPEIIERTS